jgi:hypothetical protein
MGQSCGLRMIEVEFAYHADCQSLGVTVSRVERDLTLSRVPRAFC